MALVCVCESVCVCLDVLVSLWCNILMNSSKGIGLHFECLAPLNYALGTHFH